MKHKRTSSILVISLLIAALAGCGGGGEGGITGYGNVGTGGSGGTATGTLSWAAPTTHTDGSPMTDLAGFRIYYGTASGNYTGWITLAGKTSTSMSVATLASAVPASGTYYIAVTAYDSSGIESSYSNEVSKNL
jgi:hypothetical protein